MTLKTTEEQRDELLANNRALLPYAQVSITLQMVHNLCHDADRAGELEKENADLRAKLDEAYEKAARVCENGILTADEVLSYLESGNSGDIGAAYAAMESRSNAAAIRALKEQEKP